MNKNQDKEIIGLLATVISEIREIRKTQNEHSVILNEHSVILKDHGAKLELLVNRTGDIANTVMTNDKRLTTVEKDVTEIRGGVH